MNINWHRCYNTDRQLTVKYLRIFNYNKKKLKQIFNNHNYYKSLRIFNYNKKKIETDF